MTEIDILIKKNETLKDENFELKAEFERLKKALDEAMAESDARDIENYEIAHRVRAEAINEFAAELYNIFIQYEKYDRLHIYEFLERIDSVEEFLLTK